MGPWWHASWHHATPAPAVELLRRHAQTSYAPWVRVDPDLVALLALLHLLLDRPRARVALRLAPPDGDRPGHSTRDHLMGALDLNPRAGGVL